MTTEQPNARLMTIVPTRSRPESVAKVVRAWEETDAFQHADLLFVYDADDPKAEEYEEALADADAEATRIETWMPLVPKLNQVSLAESRAALSYFAIGFAGDDHLPRTPGWAARYLEALIEMGTGIVYGDDGYQGHRLCTQWAMTSDIVRALGRMVPAPVDHLYCDNAVKDLGQGIGRLRYLPEVFIEHMHPMAQKAAYDDQYRRVNSGAQYLKDREAYTNWLTAPAGYLADLHAVRVATMGEDPNREW